MARSSPPPTSHVQVICTLKYQGIVRDKVLLQSTPVSPIPQHGLRQVPVEPACVLRLPRCKEVDAEYWFVVHGRMYHGGCRRAEFKVNTAPGTCEVNVDDGS